ncbi:hypothetical protein MARPO_0017s0031 [Marchantia polymorpha]|uniref:Uncharacterized protein n=1 Tax=Marchantia polymorpha TaxID=3197 RepID=A0A2R6XFN7_MARPO|nr:hypothetical protein MARPO_0017s0031 [Marchantia polymorpha]|eukprot:PTQ44914.1 hypothetical protein MARPO_0017s0031 [Marchantia polymorpha]
MTVLLFRQRPCPEGPLPPKSLAPKACYRQRPCSEGHYVAILTFINLPFSVIEDPFFRLFVENLSATYNPPSADMISNRILTASFAKHLEAKLEKHAKIRDLTICLDGWTDGSGSSIYGFMALWQEIEHVLEVNDLFAQRHNANFLKQEFLEVLKLNGINTSSVIACVTDNPSVMVKMRNNLKKHLAVSKKVTIDAMIRLALGLAPAWKFSKCDAVQLHKELLAYNNEDPPFKNVRKTVLSARIFWTRFSGPVPVLRRFALKILSIAPHGALIKRFFSALGLIKRKTRNRLSPSMLGQLKYELRARIANMNVRKAGEQEKGQNALAPTIEGAGLDLMMAEELEPLLQANENELEEDSMEEYFAIDDVGRDQTRNKRDEVEEDAEDGAWSIDDILGQ